MPGMEAYPRFRMSFMFESPCGREKSEMMVSISGLMTSTPPSGLLCDGPTKCGWRGENWGKPSRRVLQLKLLPLRRVCVPYGSCHAFGGGQTDISGPERLPVLVSDLVQPEHDTIILMIAREAVGIFAIEDKGNISRCAPAAMKKTNQHGANIWSSCFATPSISGSFE